jgi:hypothetical protein
VSAEWRHRDGEDSPYHPDGFCVACGGLTPWPCDAEKMRVERDAAIAEASQKIGWFDRAKSAEDERDAAIRRAEELEALLRDVLHSWDAGDLDTNYDRIASRFDSARAALRSQESPKIIRYPDCPESCRGHTERSQESQKP